VEQTAKPHKNDETSNIPSRMVDSDGCLPWWLPTAMIELLAFYYHL
jgi:hypothetical protein